MKIFQIFPLLIGIFLIVIFNFSACSKEGSEQVKVKESKVINQRILFQENKLKIRPNRLFPPEKLPHRKLPEKEVCEVELELAGSCLHSGRVFGIRWAGDRFLYVLNLHGMLIYRMNDGGEIELLSRTATEGLAHDVEVIGRYAYVADGYAGIRVFDVTDPYGPEEVGIYPTAGSVKSLTWREPFLYVSDLSEGITVFEPKGEGVLDQKGVCRIEGKAFSFHISGGYGYVCAGPGGIQAYSLKDPFSPVKAAVATDAGFVVDCAFWDDLIMAVDKKRGIKVYRPDLEKGELVLTGRYDVRGESQAIATAKGNIFLAGLYGIHQLSFDRSASKFFRTDVISPFNGFRSIDFSEAQGVMAAGDGDWGIRVFNIDAEGLHLTPLFEEGVFRLTGDIAYYKDYVYTASGGDGRHVIKVSDVLSAKSEVFRASSEESTLSVEIEEDVLYVCDVNGLSLYSLKNQSKPEFLSHIETEGRAVDVDVNDSRPLAAVADWFDGVLFFDVTDKRNPEFLSRFHAGEGWAASVRFRKNILYASFNNCGLATVDVSDPSDPVLKKINRECFAPEGISVKNNVMYVADFNSGVVIYELDADGIPQSADSINIGITKDVYIHDEYLIAANYLYGLKFFDISEAPLNPHYLGSCDTPGKAYKIAYHGDRLWVADWHSLRQYKFTGRTGTD